MNLLITGSNGMVGKNILEFEKSKINKIWIRSFTQSSY